MGQFTNQASEPKKPTPTKSEKQLEPSKFHLADEKDAEAHPDHVEGGNGAKTEKPSEAPKQKKIVM